jgi:hypothetical protein
MTYLLAFLWLLAALNMILHACVSAYWFNTLFTG